MINQMVARRPRDDPQKACEILWCWQESATQASERIAS